MAEEDLNLENQFEQLAGMTDMYDPAKIGANVQSLTPMFPNSVPNAVTNTSFDTQKNTGGLPPDYTPQQVQQNLNNPAITGDWLESLADKTSSVVNSQQNKRAYAPMYTFDSSPKGAFKDRYKAYGQETYNRIGFTPLIDNEAWYNDNTTLGDDLTRTMRTAALPMLGLGFMSPIHSYGNMLQGKSPFDTSDEEASEYDYINQLAYSSKGGLGGFTNNLVLSSAYSAGILLEGAIEGALIGGTVGFVEGGIGAVPGAALGGAAGFFKNLARLPKSLYQSAKAMGNMMKQIRTYSNLAKSKQLWKQAAGNFGKFINPLDNTIEGFKTSENMVNMARAARTVGGFWNDVKNLNMGISEGRLEGGFTKQQTYEELYNDYYNEHGVAPSAELQVQFMEQANAAGWRNSLNNAALVFYSNKIAFPSITRASFLKGTSKLAAGTTVLGKANREYQIVFNPGKKAVDGAYSIEKIGIRNALKAVTKPKVWGNTAWNYFKANVVEGFQESAQDALNDATKDYYKKTFYDSSAKNMRYVLGSLANGIDKQISAQGFETFASGFAMGTILQLPGKMVNGATMGYNRFFKNRNNWQEYVDGQKADAESMVSSLNTMYKDAHFFFDPRFSNYSNQVLAGKTVDSDDTTTKEAKDTEFAAFHSAVTTSLQNGTFDMFLDNLKSYKEATPQDIEEAWGLEKGQGQKALRDIDKNIESAQMISKRFNAAKDKMKYQMPLDDFKKGSEEYKKAQIYNRAYQVALQNFVFFQDSFDNNLERQTKLFQKLADVKAIKDLNFSEVSSLVDPTRLGREIAMLETELESLRSNPNMEYQSEINQELENKQQKINALKDFEAAQNGLLQAFFKNKIVKDLKAEMLEQDPSLSEEEVELQVLNEMVQEFEDGNTNEFVEYKNAFKNLLLSITTDPQERVKLEMELNNADSFDELYDALLDLHVINNENNGLSTYINLLSNPKDFFDHVDSNFKWMKDMYNNKEQYFKDLIESNQSAIEKNALLNELADKGIFVDLEQFADWVEDHDKLPEYFIDITNKRIINQDSIIYEEYIELFEQAAEADYKREEDPEITDKDTYKAREKDIEDSRSKALDDEKQKLDAAFKEKYGNTLDELLKEIEKREANTEQQRIDLVARINLLGNILNQLESNDYVLLEAAFQAAIENDFMTEEQYQESVARLVKIPESLQKLNKTADKIKADVDESILRDTQIGAAFQKLILSAYLTDVKDELQQKINDAETDILVAGENDEAYVLDPINVSYEEAVKQINEKHDALLKELADEFRSSDRKIDAPTFYTTDTPFKDFDIDAQQEITFQFDEFLEKELEESENLKEVDPNKYETLRDKWLKQQVYLIDELNEELARANRLKAEELAKPPKLKFLPYEATPQTKTEELGNIYDKLESILKDGEYSKDAKKPEEKTQLTSEDIENIKSDLEAITGYLDARAAAFEPRNIVDSIVRRISETIINRRDEVVEITDEDGNVIGRKFADKDDTDPRPTRVTNIAEKVKQDLTGDPQFRYEPIEKTEDGQPGAIENLFNTIFESEKLPTLKSKVDKFISRFRELAYTNYKNSFGSEKKLAELERSFRQNPTFETLDRKVRQLASKHYSDGGNTVDILTRMFLTPKAEQDGSGFVDFDYESTVDMKGLPVRISDVMSKQAFDALFKTGSGIVSKIRQGVIDGKWQILSENVLLFDENLLEHGITGEIDLLAVDTEGNVKIIDIKTGKSGTWSRFGTGEKFDKEIYFRAQQSIYSDLFYNMSGINVSSIGLLPLEIDVTLDGYINSIKSPPMMRNILEDTIEIEYLPEIVEYGIERIEPKLTKIERENAQSEVQAESTIPSSDSTQLGLKDNLGNMIIYQGKTGKLVQLPNGRYAIQQETPADISLEIALEQLKNDLALEQANEFKSEELIDGIKSEIKKLEKKKAEPKADITELLFNLKPVTDGNISIMDIGIQPISTIEKVGQQRTINSEVINAKFDNPEETIATINGVKYNVLRDNAGHITLLSYRRNDNKINRLKNESSNISKKIYKKRQDQKNTESKNDFNRILRQITRLQKEKKLIDSEIKNLLSNNPVVYVRGGNTNDYIFALSKLPNSFQKVTKDRTSSDEIRDLKEIGRLSINQTISAAIDNILAENYPETMDILIEEGLEGVAYRDGQELIDWLKESITKLEQLGFDFINRGDIVDDIVRQINSLNLLLGDIELIKLNKDGKISKRQKGEISDLFDPEKEVQERSSVSKDAKSGRQETERVLRSATKGELRDAIRKQRTGSLDILETKEEQESPLITDIKEANASTIKAAYQKAFLEANKDGSELNLDAVKEAYNERQLELDTSMLIENLIPGTYIMDRFGNITVVESKKDNEVTLRYIIGEEITKENQKDLSENYERITEEETMELEIKPEDQEIAKENIADLKKLGEDKEAIDEAKTNATDSSREDLLKQLKDNSENC
jgi:hypothetical protein